MDAVSVGCLPSGESVDSYTLTNIHGLSLRVMTYGATVMSLHVPDREGRLADVVLGFDRLEDYLAPHPYLGAIAGRVAGRISGARFAIDGCEYPLAANDPPNHLHGGRQGFDRRLWSASPLSSRSLRLSYRSPEGEEGYPGTVDVSVTYSLTDDNAFVVETGAETDRATPFSLTQHSYFNLRGEGSGTIEEHELEIDAIASAAADDNMGLTGQRLPLENADNDFQKSRRVGDAIPHLHKAHGDLYFLPPSGGEKSSRTVARLFDPESGRLMTVRTTEDCLQLYTGVALDGSLIGKSGRPYARHAGLCLECEGYPDGANTPALGDIVLRPGQSCRQTTSYTFSTR